jgi:hypothetical protein
VLEYPYKEFSLPITLPELRPLVLRKFRLDYDDGLLNLGSPVDRSAPFSSTGTYTSTCQKTKGAMATEALAAGPDGSDFSTTLRVNLWSIRSTYDVG